MADNGGGRGGKRGGGGDGGGGNKNKKAKYYSKPSGSSGQAIPVGRPGVMITCDPNWETRAQNEAMVLIEEHYDKLAGPSSTPAPKAEAEGAKKDISALLAAEVKELKNKSNQRFTPHNMGVNGCIYIMFPENIATPSPVDVVISIMQEAQQTKMLRGRHCNRILPIMHSSFAGLEEINTMAPKAVDGMLPKVGEEGISIAVDYEHRSAQGLDRMSVIDAFVNHIPMPPNVVNLKDPKMTVIVQICRNSCGVSVVPLYKELARFNIKKLTETEEEAANAARLAAIGKARRDRVANAAAAKTVVATTKEAKPVEAPAAAVEAAAVAAAEAPAPAVEAPVAAVEAAAAAAEAPAPAVAAAVEEAKAVEEEGAAALGAPAADEAKPVEGEEPKAEAAADAVEATTAVEAPAAVSPDA